MRDVRSPTDSKVERHKQATKCSEPSSPGELRRVFINPRENPRLIVLILPRALHSTYRFKRYERLFQCRRANDTWVNFRSSFLPPTRPMSST